MTTDASERDVRTGHIKIARKVFSADNGDPFWNEPRVYSKFEAWVDLIQLAAFRTRRYATLDFGSIELQRGEFVASRRFLATRWQWTEKRVRVFLENITKQGRIEARETARAGTVYHIVKYDIYQSGATEKGPLKGQDGGQQGAQQGPKIEAVKAVKAVTAWTAEAGDDWKELRDGIPNHGRIGAALKPLVDERGWPAIRPAWRRFLSHDDAKFGPAYFAQHFGKYNGSAAPGAASSDVATQRAQTLWPIYKRVGFVSAKPSMDKATMVAADEVARGTSPSPAEFIAEMRVAEPWAFGGMHSDAAIVGEIAKRLRSWGEYAEVAR